MFDKNKKEKDANQTEKNLKTVTDSRKDIDGLQSGKMQLWFRCSQSGLYYPADYIAQWGRKYGIGLGKAPVSESLYTMWEQKVANPARLKSVTQIMYPLGVSKAQVDSHIVPANFINGSAAIIDLDDPFMDERAGIVREKQFHNKNGKLRALLAIHDKGGLSYDIKIEKLKARILELEGEKS